MKCGSALRRGCAVTQAVDEKVDHAASMIGPHVVAGLQEARPLATGHEVGPDALAVQLDVTDQASITAAAERIRKELGRLDVLVNNAAISNTRLRPGVSVEEYAKSTRPSNVSLDEVRAVWETNVFGVLAVYPGDAAAPARGAGSPHRQRVERRWLADAELRPGLSPTARSSAPSTLRPRRLSTR